MMSAMRSPNQAFTYWKIYRSIRFDLSYGNKQAQYEILKGLNISNCRIHNPSEAEGAAAATQDL